MFRRTAALAALTLAASLAAIISSPAQAADPTLVVPDSPSGDVVVTATADAATAPYLQVRAIRDEVVPPYDGIAPAPVINEGSALSITVPTWGLHRDATSFVLLSCVTAEPTSCATPLATQVRAVTQTVSPTATVELPDALPVFLPEEKVYISAHNEGGGEMRAFLNTWDTPQQVLSSGVRTEFTAYPSRDAGDQSLVIQRCSVVSTVPYCEWQSATRLRMPYMREPALELSVPNYGRPITLNPAWSGSTWDMSAHVRTAGHDYDLSWELRNLAGGGAGGPVQVAADRTDPHLSFDFAPGQAVGALADGDYDAVFRVTVTKGELAKNATITRRISVANNPPKADPKIYSAQRRIINKALLPNSTLPRSATFRVQALHTQTVGNNDAVIRLRNSRGAVVERREVDHPCHFYCSRLVPWTFEFEGRWPMSTKVLAPGTYRAEATLRDEFGRAVTKDLGPVYILKGESVRRTVRLNPARTRVRGLGHTGRCSSVRQPGRHGWPGSVELRSLSQCRSTAGMADLVSLVLRTKVPPTSGWAETYDHPTIFVGFRGRLTGGPSADSHLDADCRLPARSKVWRSGGRSHGDYGWEVCDLDLGTRSDRLTGTPLELRLRVRNGVSLDLRNWRIIVTYPVWRVVR